MYNAAAAVEVHYIHNLSLRFEKTTILGWTYLGQYSNTYV